MFWMISVTDGDDADDETEIIYMAPFEFGYINISGYFFSCVTITINHFK